MAWPNSYDSLPHVGFGTVVNASPVNNQSSALNALESFIGLSPQNGYATVAQALVALSLVPPKIVPGTVYCFGGNAAPTGYLLCDGSSVSQSTYSALFAVIGTTFGGVGLNFNLPDLRGRVAMGSGSGTGLTPRSVAGTGGEDTHVLAVTEIPSHTHSYNSGTPFLVQGGGNNQNLGAGVPPGGVTDTAIVSSTTGTNTPHNNLQPYLALNYIIKT